ncbi:hypothetical protein [Massilia eurypsychrophila]|uniref:hypothetical protein n=1 Tax=Massilia eurypsychrophila TaxID=1485217 RepID=UPI001033A78F|nr:hypothetical protein [Massilia eurypsychrophila]
MNLQPDIAIYSPDQKLVLVVEIKGTPKSDDAWAATLRRNLVAHGAVPAPAYFLLVVSDRIYLWKNVFCDDAVLPSYSEDTRTVLHKYLPQTKKTDQPDTVSKTGLELAVRSWLRDLTAKGANVDEVDPGNWLRRSGLYETIRRGEVRDECQA